MPSQANFLMVDVRRDVAGLQAACRRAGVLIARPFPPLTTCARVTVGTLDEMQRALGLILRPSRRLRRRAWPARSRRFTWAGEC